MLFFFLGILVGVIGGYMWRVPASQFGHPKCKRCRGTGHEEKLFA